MYMMLFNGKKLKEIREYRGLTQRALAKKTGLHITTIGKYEINRREPKATQLKLLSDALGVMMEDFFQKTITGGENSKEAINSTRIKGGKENGKRSAKGET